MTVRLAVLAWRWLFLLSSVRNPDGEVPTMSRGPASSSRRRMLYAGRSGRPAIVLCNTVKMTAVDHPNRMTPFIAVNGTRSSHCYTGVLSPEPSDETLRDGE